MISVCIATYNGEKYIAEQLQSIVSQLGDEDEIIISDDYSTDRTLEIVKQFDFPGIRIVNGPRKHSPIPNFECAMRHAKGDFIFLSDQDDVWEPNKIALMMKALETADCVVSDCWVTDGNLTVTSESFYALNKTHVGKYYNLFLKNGYLGCCMAMRRNVIDRCLPFPENIPMHDIWIGNVAAFYFKVVFIPDRLIRFRRHDNNASVTAKKSHYSLLQKLGFRYTVLKNLIKR